MATFLAANFWLIPLLPLAAAFLILTLRASRTTAGFAFAVRGQIAALTMAIGAFVSTLALPGAHAVQNFTWFTFGNQVLRLGVVLDPLAAAMLVMITFVSLCIFVFSKGYMAGDKDFTRFFAYLSFFSAAMLGVVIANSLLLLFISWELVGLASYLLIGFWIHKPSAAAAAKKAFITTRIGDLGFFLGLLWLYRSTGTLLFYDDGKGCLEAAGLLAIGSSATFIALLIFFGAVGKSGQFPLHVWLPDAMEGPTPVSALIHAATMVAAGVFLVARVYPLFSLGAINGVTSSLIVVVWIGVTTALMAALIAIAQADIKRILAYSTVSQLGLMMVSLGVGGVAAGIMHLLAHGFFKALLFLGAGSVIHGLHHEQDLRKMGGLRGQMPLTFMTYAVGMLALSGAPLLFSGGWTKEEILVATSHWPVSRAPYLLLIAGVVLTAFYMTRQVVYVFFGNRGPEAHESPRVMTIPLVVLALGSIVLSIVLTPAWPWLEHYLSGEAAAVDLTRLFQPVMVTSLLFVTAGIAAGAFLYRATMQDRQRDSLERALPALFSFLANRMWVDELYASTIILLSKTAARMADWLDRYFWDGLVRAAGAPGRTFRILPLKGDERAINAGVDRTRTGGRGFGRMMSSWHSGQIQTYLGAIALGLVALLLLYAWLG